MGACDVRNVTCLGVGLCHIKAVTWMGVWLCDSRGIKWPGKSHVTPGCHVTPRVSHDSRGVKCPGQSHVTPGVSRDSRVSCGWSRAMWPCGCHVTPQCHMAMGSQNDTNDRCSVNNLVKWCLGTLPCSSSLWLIGAWLTPLLTASLALLTGEKTKHKRAFQPLHLPYLS